MTKPKGRSRSPEKIPVVTERQAKMLVVLLCVGLSVIAVSPFFLMGQADAEDGVRLHMIDTHDMQLHFDQMKSFQRGLAAGEIYPRWEEDTNRGFGAPTTSYYPPGVYYLTGGLYAIVGDWWRAIFNAHLIMMIASGAVIYLYARKVMSRGPAAVAMATYILFPYHLVDQYHRGAIAELLGFVWMPLMLLFGERILSRRSSGTEQGSDSGAREERDGRTLWGRMSDWRVLFCIVGLAASYAAFLWSHTPTGYQFSLAFGVFAVVAALMLKDWRGLLLLGGAVIIGVALSAAYLYPAAVEQNLIHHEYISQTWPYHKTYVFVHDLPYADATHPFFRMIDTIWASGTAAILLSAAALLVFKRRQLSPELKGRVVLWTIIGCFASFMMTKVSYPIGRLIPMIDIGVFTWRMLSITCLAVALLAGACVQAATRGASGSRKPMSTVYWSVAMLILMGSVSYSAIKVVAPLYNAPLLEPSLEHLNYATLPLTAPEEPLDLPEVDRAELAMQSGRITIDAWNPEHRALKVELSSADDLLIRTFDFPGWTATVDGQRAQITRGEQLGDITLRLQPGTHSVRLDYLETPPRRVGDRITLLSFSVTFALVVAAFFLRARKSSSLGAKDKN